MAKRRCKRKPGMIEGGEVAMTPMIDVVFQLLVYFVFTMKPMDIAAHLDVFRPSASAPPDEKREQPKMIQIQVLPGDLVINGRSMDLPRLTTVLQKLAENSKTQTVVIMCARASKHDQLINVLDRCAEAGLSNLSVLSMN